jgi:hypothetical protein
VGALWATATNWDKMSHFKNAVFFGDQIWNPKFKILENLH